MSEPWSPEQRRAIYGSFWSGEPVRCPSCDALLNMRLVQKEEGRFVSASCPQCARFEDRLNERDDPLFERFRKWTEQEGIQVLRGPDGTPCPIDGYPTDCMETDLGKFWVHCPRCGNNAYT